jgi:hypothetical protein
MALRIRVNISAIGSVIKTNCQLPIADFQIGNRQLEIGNSMFLPARLNDAGDLTLQRQLAKTDAAQIELPQVTSRPPHRLHRV